MSFTPGPWQAEMQWEGSAIKARDGKETVARVSRRADLDNEIANANLITAAPLLLQAAKQALETGAINSRLDRLEYEALKNAIEKAESSNQPEKRHP